MVLGLSLGEMAVLVAAAAWVLGGCRRRRQRRCCQRTKRAAPRCCCQPFACLQSDRTCSDSTCIAASLPACLQVQRSCQGSPVPQVRAAAAAAAAAAATAASLSPRLLPCFCCQNSAAAAPSSPPSPCRPADGAGHRFPVPHQGPRLPVCRRNRDDKGERVGGRAGGRAGGWGSCLACQPQHPVILAGAPYPSTPGASPCPAPLCLRCPPLPCAAAPGGSGHHAPAARHPQRAAGGHQHLPPTRVGGAGVGICVFAEGALALPAAVPPKCAQAAHN